MSEIRFTKLSGTGNDFILIDNRRKILRGDEYPLIEGICRRRTGVGADGVLLIEQSDTVHFRMRYYNADGFEAEMCGNGARACAYYAYKNDIAPAQMKFAVGEELYEATVEGQFVSLLMQEPQELVLSPGILETENFQEGGYLVLGVPHYVLFCDNIEQVDVEKTGAYYCEHAAFHPRKTNVNFVSDSGGLLKIRTYERGVNAETLSCGTGTVSSAIILNRMMQKPLPMEFQALGGRLQVDLDSASGRHLLRGEVEDVYHGVLQTSVF